MQDKNQTTETAQAPQTQVDAKVTAVINRAAQGDFVRKIVEKIKSSENILVALSRNPSVDEISAAIGLTLFLDGMQKHTTAIYSGQTPDTLAFLKPEATFETNTDTLQDFIISLSKDKADHLRYKLEGDFVKVYITPYKTTISEEDLSFARGDYNVDFVIALNVSSASELDEALAEHGRIMHDASAVDITRGAPGKFGEIEWSNPAASSVSEMVTELIFRLQGSDKALDADVATALLTGIVAATERFSNNRTTPETLKLASKLMEMGADQQLISANVLGNQKLGNGEAPAVVADDVGMMADFGTPVIGVANVATETSGAEPTEQVSAESVIVEPVVNPAAQAAGGIAGVDAPAPEAVVSATNQVVPEETSVQPVLPEGMTNAPAAAEATNEGSESAKKDYAQMLEQALAEPVPSQAAQAQQMMQEQQAQMLRGAQQIQAMQMVQAQQQAAQMQQAQQAAMQQQMAAQQAMQAQQQMAQQQAMMQQQAQQSQQQAAQAQQVNAPQAAARPTAEPVPNRYAEVLPPPPAPTAGPDMMPPSLPPVQVPEGA